MLHRLNNIKIFTKVALAKATVKKRDYSTWIFSSSFNTKFNYNSKFLFEHIFEHEPDIHPLYVMNDDAARQKLQEEYGEKYFIETKSIEGIKKVLNAGVWFSSAGLPVYGFGLNRDRLIVALGHGVPLKKIALMENNLSRLTRLYFKYIFSDNYTHVLTTSVKLSRIMAESYGVNEDKIKVWGQPRNDSVYKKNNRKEILSSLYGGLPDYKKTILYAPTFRSEDTRFFPFSDFNADRLEAFLDENGLIIFIRCHQSETNAANLKLGSRVRLMNQDKVAEIMDIINIFDLLATDYSSIYIDFLLTGKPVFFLPYDRKEYLRDRGLNFEYDEVTPGPKPETLEAFEAETLRLLEDETYYQEERLKTNLFFNEFRAEASPNICCEIKKEISLKHARVSLSFDDGREDIYRVAYKIMKEYGLTGTIHVTTGYMDGTWEGGKFNSSAGPVTKLQIKEMRDYGFEISSHGDWHVTEKKDILNSVEKLRSWGLIDEGAGFSIPKSQLTAEQKNGFAAFLKDNGVMYMRGGRSPKCYTLRSKACYVLYNVTKLQLFYDLFNRSSIMNPEGPGRTDSYDLLSVVVRREDNPLMIAEFIRKNAVRGSWIILMLHGIQKKGDQNYDKDQWCWDSDKFRQLCRELKCMNDAGEIKVSNIMDVIREREV